MSILFNGYTFYLLLVYGVITNSSGWAASNRDKRAEPSCSSAQFSCLNGECISKFDVCDGRKDCTDGSDENHVTCTRGCPKNTFRCAYGGCVDGDKMCDGVTDCADNSDEVVLNCTNFKWLEGNFEKCKREEFQCRDGQCIDRYKICDGMPDCRDASDETATQCNRPSFQCLPSNFRCAYGGCIEGLLKCDGRKDCADGSDEADFLCSGAFIGDKGYKPTTPKPGPDIQLPTPETPVRGDSCIVPDSDATKYSRDPCPDYNSCAAIKSNTVVSKGTALYLNCREGYAIELHPIIVCTTNGKWSPEKTSCVRLCKGISSSEISVIQCTYKGADAACNKGVLPGTKAQLSCAQGYTIIGSSLYLSNVCNENGNWLNPIQRCTHECGILPSQALISDGVRANKTNHPWHAGLYQVFKNTTTQHICGGTLITPYIILTAAHCVFTDTGKLVRASKVLIALGKEYRDIGNTNDADTAQHLEVERIFAHPNYDGKTVNFFCDVALIELKTPATLSAFIMPACIDTNNRYTLTNTSTGTVVGFGFDRPNGQPTDTLQKADLPYVSHSDCRKILAPTNGSDTLTKDKFCAFYQDRQNTTSVQSGDSGGGLVFKFEGGRHYVLGLVSTKLMQYVNTFTDIRSTYNMEFLNDVVQNITKRRVL